jgi:hypothetical protein
MTQRQEMYAELLFPEARDLAVVELTGAGFAVEILDWEDPEGSTCVWVKVRGAYEGSDDEFFNEMVHLARQFGGDVYEAGYLHPPTFA